MEEIIEYDEHKNIVYKRYKDGLEVWKKFDEKKNKIYYKNSKGYESWSEYNKNDNLIHYKNNKNYEKWFKWKKNKQIEITKQEFEQIKRIEFNSRTKVSRFKLMDI